MTRHHWLKNGRRTIAVLATCLLAVAACGGGGDDDSASKPSTDAQGASSGASDGVTEAQAAIEAAKAVVAYEAVATPFDTSKASGREVWAIMPSLYAITQTFADGLERSFDATGIEFRVIDGKNDVAEYNRRIEGAVSADVDAIILFIDAALVAGAVRDAVDAGVTVIQASEGLPGEAPKVDGMAASVTWDYRVPARLMADWFIADSNGEGHAVLLTTDEYRASVIMREAFAEEVDRLCPDRCEVTVEDVPIAEWATGLQTRTQSVLQRESGVTHILPVFDGMVPFVIPAIGQTGASSSVSIGSFNASANVLAELQKPDSPLKMDIGNSNYWFAYTAADTTMRLLAGEEPIDDYKIGFRLFDASNIQDIGELAEENEASWYGHDYFAEFEKVWASE